MSVQKELTVNHLPAKTWYWLQMNDSKISVDMEQVVDAPYQEKVTGTEIYCKEDQCPEEFWNQIETGMGKDVEVLFHNQSILIINETDSKKQSVLFQFEAESQKTSTKRILIHAKRNTDTEVTLVLNSEDAAQGIQALQTKIYAEEGANVKIFVVQLLGKEMTGMFDLGGICEKDASIELVKLELGAGRLYAGGSINLKDRESTFEAKIGYSGRKTQKLDMNYVVKHLGKNTVSNMQVSGVLRDTAEKLFRGTIDFRKGCSGAKGDEAEEVLLLGDEAINRTIPLILCQEEEVEGNHGATIGRLSDDMLFYLGSRGIENKAAENMIARAKLDAIANLVPEEGVKEQIWRWYKNEGL